VHVPNRFDYLTVLEAFYRKVAQPSAGKHGAGTASGAVANLEIASAGNGIASDGHTRLDCLKFIFSSS